MRIDYLDDFDSFMREVQDEDLLATIRLQGSVTKMKREEGSVLVGVVTLTHFDDAQQTIRRAEKQVLFASAADLDANGITAYQVEMNGKIREVESELQKRGFRVKRGIYS